MLAANDIAPWRRAPDDTSSPSISAAGNGRRRMARPPAHRERASLSVAAAALGGRIPAGGGGGDIVSRIMAAWLAERLGQPVIVENKPGAASNISVQAVANAPADGYTLLFVPASAAVNVSLFDNLSFSLLRDIAPVSGLIDFPLVVVPIPHSRRAPSPSSSPTPRPSPARSAWARSAPARPRMCRASCSR
jgi:hypothetical protein